MQKWKALFVTAGLGLALFLVPVPSPAQEPEEPDEPAEPVEPAPPAPEPAAPSAEQLTPASGRPRFALYVSAGYGSAGTDTIDISNETFVTTKAENFFEIDEQKNGRAALGWKFAAGKGDLRLLFNGYEEESYEFRSRGLQDFVTVPKDGPGSTRNCTTEDGDPCLLPWWELTVQDGQLRSTRTPPTWSPFDDRGVCSVSMNPCTVGTQAQDCPGEACVTQGIVNPDEVELGTVPDAQFEVPFLDSLQNQVQTWDALYGREFGTRRLTSHWWAGVRFFEFAGNIPSASWVNVDFAGGGYPDGSFIRPIVYHVESRGGGPSGAWSIDWNFFEKRFVLFAKGAAAFTFNDLESDSGLFFVLVRPAPLPDVPTLFVPAPARLQDQRNKSTWQTQATAGLRLNLRNGLELELAYQINGYLDAILIPITYNVPQNELQVDLDDPFANVSAIFSTRDYVIDGYYGSVGFQF